MRALIAVAMLLDLGVVAYTYLIRQDMLSAIFFLCAGIFLEVLDVELMLKEKSKGE